MYLDHEVCIRCECISYLTAGHDPVRNGEERKPHSHTQYRPALHPYGLLPETLQVLIPESQELLLAIRMGHKLGTNNSMVTDKAKCHRITLVK